jgi:uncharacterized protein YbaP (TraB family)
MNIRKVIFGFTLLLAACASSGYAKPSTLWEISKDGNYLFLAGSIHLLRSQDYPMPAAFESAYKKSSILILEADIDMMTEPDMLEYIYKNTMLPAGQTLQNVLNEDAYKRLEEFVGPAAIEALSRYKPSVIMASLQTLYLQASGFTEKGADLYYLEKSKEDGKSVGFLEDAKIQIDMLAYMADGIENEYVLDAVDELPKSADEAITLVSEWKEGIATSTETMLNTQKTQWPAVYKITILNRNSAWMPVIETYLTTKPIEFVIVGMGHLYGPDGLLSQLRNKGYTVKQLVNK